MSFVPSREARLEGNGIDHKMMDSSLKLLVWYGMAPGIGK